MGMLCLNYVGDHHIVFVERWKAIWKGLGLKIDAQPVFEVMVQRCSKYRDFVAALSYPKTDAFWWTGFCGSTLPRLWWTGSLTLSTDGRSRRLSAGTKELCPS